MTPIPHHAFYLPGIAALAVTAGLFVRVRSTRNQSSREVPAPPSISALVYADAEAPVFAGGGWQKLGPDRAKGGLAMRFRLAGTLFGVGTGLADVPLAVMDDREEIRQLLVRQGEMVSEGIRLVEVRAKSVILEGPEGQAELFLERVDARKAVNVSGGTQAATEGDGNRFGGHEVFPGRWSFSREKLLDYYTELRAEPERLVAIFDSMEPLWKDGDPSTRVIEGYQLNVQGERAFFEAMGMKQGDIVRAVNSVPMANRRRAERCIAAFVQGEEDTFVFDIEREGEASQQVYVFE